MWLFRWLATLEVHEWVSLARLALILIVGSIVVWEVYGPSWRKAKPSVPRPMARCPQSREYGSVRYGAGNSRAARDQTPVA